MKKAQNTFVALLDLLGVKHTGAFANRLFNEHPHKDNLFGLSEMLSGYGIENVAIRFKQEEKEQSLSLLEAPFIAYVGNNFGVIRTITDREVHYVWNDKKISLDRETFLHAWSGVVLLPETNEHSGETDYKAHRLHERMESARNYSLATIALLLAGYITYVSRLLCLCGV